MLLIKQKAVTTFYNNILLLILPISLMLLSSIDPKDIQLFSRHLSPYGYTISLSLFILPVVILTFWFLTTTKEIKVQKNAVKITLFILISLGFVLDVFFGNTYFNFANETATIGIRIPVRGGTVPIEEFIFYIFGFTLILFLYIWSDEYWNKACNKKDSLYNHKMSRPLHFHPYSILIGGTLLLAAICYKKLFADNGVGFPWYFTYLIFTAIIPACGLYSTVKSYINWHAVIFTAATIFLISYIWETTLALPLDGGGIIQKQ